MTKVAAYRYAVYYAPTPQSQAWELGSQWLGRCAASGQMRDKPTIDGLTSAEFKKLTAAPRRYGWHATLKAPFSLAQGVSETELRICIDNLAQSLSEFEIPALQVSRLDDFLALTPCSDSTNLNAMASTCVTQLAPFAAPLGYADLQRRRAARLTARQDELLVRWGYPYVLEEFRFHCSLTGSLSGLSSHQIEAVEQAAKTFFDNIPTLRFTTLALFAEPTPGADFVLLEHFKLRP
jgi:putative phosphonate metabolism protein